MTDGPDTPSRVAGLRRRTALGALAAGLVVGGFAGGYAISQAATTASPSASPSTGGSTTTPPADHGPGDGVFHPNEDPAHEKGESAAREAQENAGQRPTVP